VEVIQTDTDVPENWFHWHGLFIPPEVDGVEEGGDTNGCLPHGRIRVSIHTAACRERPLVPTPIYDGWR